MNQPTVKQLRQAGFKVRVLHKRKYEYKHPPEKFDRVKYLSCKGGETEVVVTSPDGQITTSGFAKCHFNDFYVKKEGVKIAISRAYDHLIKEYGYRAIEKNCKNLSKQLCEGRYMTISGGVVKSLLNK